MESQTGTFAVKQGLPQMLKGGVIMDVVTAEHARIAEEALANPPRLALDTEYREGAEALLDDLLRN